MNNHDLLSLIDLTLLDSSASQEMIQNLQKEGEALRVAALCILPQHLSALKFPATTQIATVVNFPHGKERVEQVLAELERICTYPITEIDYVFPYALYLEDKKQDALSHCREIYEFCLHNNKVLKVILETGMLPPSLIRALSQDIINIGCHFLKTSTGKVPIGATPLAAQTILKAIHDSGAPCGIKVSGGIKTKAQAEAYITLAENIMNKKVDASWFRIGASQLIRELN